MIRERILLVQTAFLGDVILTTPLLAALRRHDPAAEITMLVTPAAAPSSRLHPALDRLLVDDKRASPAGLRGLLPWFASSAPTASRSAVAAHKSVRTALGSAAGGIPRRIGFATAPAAALYTDRVPRPARRSTTATGFSACSLRSASWRVAGGGRAAPDRRRCRDPRPRRRRCWRRMRTRSRPLAAICPGSAWRTKRWPASVVRCARPCGSTPTATDACCWAPAERALTAAVQQRPATAPSISGA